MQKKIFVSITTTRGVNWRKTIEEATKLGSEETALFLTCLHEEERKEMYELVRKSTIKSIPLVHIREDMKLDELDYFVENYGTKVFCRHAESEYPPMYDYSKYQYLIAIENVYNFFDEDELKNAGGICLDISHLENDRLLKKERFEFNSKILGKYPILCNHISAIKRSTYIDSKGEVRYSNHNIESLSEFDYLKRYPSNYFSPILAIELENTIKEQMAFRDYLEKLIL